MLFSTYFPEGIALSDELEIANFYHQMAPQFMRNCDRRPRTLQKSAKKVSAHNFV